ncbi:MAG: aminotransferase class I/II-fold pyridoxal phosphate-dependent enzyme [Clostridiales bacterium]|nr:aminotransferase class I/II-fold pyridoxal phosphate-dependent enzyme [Clostridiales bacterium]
MLDYNRILSEKVLGTKPSGIRKFFDLLEEMKDVISLTVGQPDFVTPWHIREAGIESLEKGKTYYTSNSGTIELRKEISKYLSRRFSLGYSAENEIIVTVGGSEAIDIALRAVINKGDEIIIPSPCFVCYDPLVSISGGIPVIVNTRMEDKFKLTPELLKSAITPKTKALILSYPNNPTGAIMTKEDLEPIVEILRDTDILVISDEIYAELTYGKNHCSIATFEGMRERTIVVNGFSKAYAMTGWRLGYVAAPVPITEQMLKIHQYCIMCSPTTSQFAAIQAMREGDPDVRMMCDEYDRRRRYLLHHLERIDIDCFEPEGAFYVFPYVGKFGMTSEQFCERLLFEKGVAIVPGGAFGDCGEGFARISYAYSIQHLTVALERIEEFVNELKAQN